MISSFDNKGFASDDFFRLEQERIFSKYWIFVCFKFMVDQPNRFATRDIAGVPVLVQNIGGEIQAFRNVCAHRQRKLQDEDFGTRKMTCKYHGWHYGADGKLLAVPYNDEYYHLSQEDICKIKLESFRVEIVGEFVFVNLDKDPIAIDKQFSQEMTDLLKDLSGHFNREMLISKFSFNANWKLVNEVLRDNTHIPFLHTRSLFSQLDHKVDPPPEDHGQRSSRIPDVQEISGGGLTHIFNDDKHPVYADKVNRWGDVDGYFEWRFFPNLHVVCPRGGYGFSIEYHHPIAPDKTQATVYMMTAATKANIPASFLWGQMKGARVVLDEDYGALEAVQAVVGQAPGHSVLGGGEHEMSALRNLIASLVRGVR
ncbi:MAG: Rieske 2Fe-2S domain-containing protein [Alphaproteobacteria bacterium]|nr:Rieske 2Fe-2S domain-containing protein [Alphaproteobacteria bacterium]MBV8549605.1 Rieske 2Fe-2S domain-containing protein [Alphaproteobacteria bacterium]